MSAYIKEHSIRIHLEQPEGMSAAEHAIEVDCLIRSVDRIFEAEANEREWRWL